MEIKTGIIHYFPELKDVKIKNDHIEWEDVRIGCDLCNKGLVSTVYLNKQKISDAEKKINMNELDYNYETIGDKWIMEDWPTFYNITDKEGIKKAHEIKKKMRLTTTGEYYRYTYLREGGSEMKKVKKKVKVL